MYAVYMLRCADGTLYTGITTDLVRRLREHNTSRLGAKYTRSRRPVRLAYSQRCRTRGRALRVEATLKQLSRSAKLRIVASRRR